MGGRDDDIPDYLRGVDQPGFRGVDKHTIRPDAPAPHEARRHHELAPLGDLDGVQITEERTAEEARHSPPQPVDGGAIDDPVDEGPSFQVPTALILNAALAFVGAGVLMGMLFFALIGLGMTKVNDWERETRSRSGQLAAAVDQDRAIIDELASMGGDRGELEALYSAFRSARDHERGLAALAFADGVDKQAVNIGDIRGTAVAKRQRRIGAARNAFAEARYNWEWWSDSAIGRTACTLGMATCY